MGKNKKKFKHNNKEQNILEKEMEESKKEEKTISNKMQERDNEKTEGKSEEERNISRSEELKKEATETVNQVKETIKKVDIKKDSVETKGFIIDMFRNPLKKMQQIVNRNTGKFLTYAIIILIIWVVAELVNKSFSFGHVWKYSNIGSALVSTILAGITPIVSVLVMSVIIFIMNKNSKKKLTSIITVVVAASIPLVIASVVQLLTIYSTQVSLLTTPFSKLCNVISIILMYFAIKTVFGSEKNSEFIKKFILVETIYYVVYIVLSLLNIYI